MLTFATCKSDNKSDTPLEDLSSMDAGKISKIYCGRCHEYPDPGLLDKETWVDKVLPEMSFYLGIRPLTEKMFATNEKDFRGLLQSGYFPDKPLLRARDWERIIDFYKTNAPDSLVQPKRKKLNFYKGIKYQLENAKEGTLPFISMVVFDQNDLYVANALDNTLKTINQLTKHEDILNFNSPVVDLIVRAKKKYVLEIGMMNPNDRFLGTLKCLSADNKVETIIDSLNRPVDVNMADLDGDGIEDYVICSFGDKIGSLDWYSGKDFSRHVLSLLPGSRVTYIQDFNQDGWNDVLALFSQGREKISIFYNDGKGRFQEMVLSSFPPVYGSSYIDVGDVDGDGRLDILYTSGDNADLSKIPKPYHGLYILINEAKDKYTSKYFYPINGASMVKSNDLDNDGDLDFVVNAYFSQKSDKDRIIVFENKRNTISDGTQGLNFDLWTLDHTSNGNWLVMDINKMTKAMVFGCMSFPQTGNQGGVAVILANQKLK